MISFVFVHLGSELPAYLPVALEQCRRFNRGRILLLAEDEALRAQRLDDTLDIDIRSIGELELPRERTAYLLENSYDPAYRQGFLIHTTDRFFVIEGAMRTLGLENVIHLENDNLVYFDASTYEGVLTRNYRGLGATFDSDRRVVAGLLFIRSPDAVARFNRFVADRVRREPDPGVTDMDLLARWRAHGGAEWIDNLPILPADHGLKLRNSLGESAARPENFTKNFVEFQSIFDAAAIGQYLGGIDPRNSDDDDTDGFVNETCIFDASSLRYRFGVDNGGRRVPFVDVGDHCCRINNLHIHSKNLARFRSFGLGELEHA